MLFNKRLCKPILFSFLSAVLVLSSVFSHNIQVYAENQSANLTVTANVYHVHTGSESGGGGCYTVENSGSESYEERCTGHLIYYPSYNETKCDGCGASYTGERSGDCPHSETKYRSYTYYSLGCGMSNNTVIGTFSASKSTDDWTKELTVNMSHSGRISVASSPYSVNGTSTSSSEYRVTENGTYTLTLNTTGNCKKATIQMPITNIDHTAPAIEHYSLTPSDWTNGNVTFTADSVTDKQPVGTEGCGLADEFMSYDNGKSWTCDTSHIYSDNGTYTVMVRDKLDNTSSTTFTISNIDREAPRILSVDYDDTLNIRSTIITITADDIRADKSEGAGLHEEAYSYDGGNTWTSDNTFRLNENQTVKIAVRDRFDNTAFHDTNVTNLDCYGPIISYECWPYKDTDKDVDIYFSAADINPDGKPGVGLAPLYFSYDNGRTWTDKTTVTLTSNGNVDIMAKDKNGNTSFLTVKVDWIDKSHSNEDFGEPDSNPKPTPSVTPTPPVKPVEKKKKDTVVVTPTPTVEPTIITKQIILPSKDAPILKSEAKEPITVTPTGSDTSKKGLSLGQLLALILGILALLALLGLLLFLLFGMVKVYCTGDSKSLKLVGITRVRHKNDCYEINIDETIIANCESTLLRLKLPPLFADIHGDDRVIIYLPDNQSYDEAVKEVIDITFKVVK